MLKHFVILAAACFSVTLGWAQSSAPPEIDRKEGDAISKYLIDFAAADVSAAGFLGLSSDAVTVVENPKSLALALRGFGTSGTTFGISIAPARGAWAPLTMTLGTYKKSHLNRLMGASTFSYAQGSQLILNKETNRRAVAYSTHLYFNAEEDPVLAGMECPWRSDFVQPGTSEEAAQAIMKDATAKYLSCVVDSQTRANKKWNAAKASLSMGTGWARVADGTGSTVSLGNSVVLGATYGFTAAEADMALSVTARRTSNEPVLESLVNGPIQRVNKTVAGLRLTGGSLTLRALLEVSNSTQRETSASERVFRRAAGVDYRVSEGAWISLRLGKMRTVDGKGDETVSLATLNFSPKQ